MKKISIALIITMVFMMLATMSVFAANETSKDLTGYSNASQVTLKNLRTKEEKIDYYSEKYGDNTAGVVAYYINRVQKYSIPICFLGIVWGAFNFFIIGNKKLQKREQGFSMIVGFTIGLIVFQIIPLIYAIFVAGRW